MKNDRFYLGRLGISLIGAALSVNACNTSPVDSTGLPIEPVGRQIKLFEGNLQSALNQDLYLPFGNPRSVGITARILGDKSLAPFNVVAVSGPLGVDGKSQQYLKFSRNETAPTSENNFWEVGVQGLPVGSVGLRTHNVLSSPPELLHINYIEGTSNEPSDFLDEIF